MIRRAISRIFTRSRMADFWIQVKASHSFIAELVHQDALGPLDQPPGLQLLLEAS